MDDETNKVREPLLHDKDFGAQVAAGFLKGAIIDGALDPTGKSDEDFWDEFKAYVMEKDEDGDYAPILVTLSFEETLLGEARRYLLAKQWRLAVVMYATWVEHRVNDLLSFGGRSRQLDDVAIMQVLRTPSIDAKTGIIWLLLFDEPFPGQLAKRIKALAEKRNSFVHYKWPAFHADTGDDGTESFRAAAFAAEALVDELNAFYDERVLNNFDVDAFLRRVAERERRVSRSDE